MRERSDGAIGIGYQDIDRNALDVWSDVVNIAAKML